MQPDNQQYPTNYLDTIAAQPQAKTMSPVLLWAMIGGVLLFAIVVVMFLFSLGGENADKFTRFAARMSNLQTVSAESQERVKSNELRTLNSSLTLVLTNANRDLKAPLAAAEIELDDQKVPEIVAVTDETAELNKRLEDARLNAVFDRTYAREITFYLKTLRTEMEELYNATSNPELQKILETTDTDLGRILTSFATFNDS